MRKFISVLLAFLFMLSAPGVLLRSSAAAAGTFASCAADADSAIVFDQDARRIIYAKNEEKKVAPASLTKLLTAAVALKYVSPKKLFTVGSEQYLVHYYSSLACISIGEKLTLRQLVYAMLLPSGNDAAYAVAVNVARIVSGNTSMSDTDAVNYFCSLMNDYAKHIGAKSSHFINPDGWDETEHYSTAYDLMEITRTAFCYQTIVDALSTQDITITASTGQTHVWYSSNYLIREQSPYYNKYVVGGKTGTTNNAGYCLTARAVKNGKGYIAVALNCPNEDSRFRTVSGLLNVAISGRPAGDVNGDYEVTAADARLALRITVGLSSANSTRMKYGDLDKNGEITPGDARNILRLSVGLPKN